MLVHHHQLLLIVNVESLLIIALLISCFLQLYQFKLKNLCIKDVNNFFVFQKIISKKITQNCFMSRVLYNNESVHNLTLCK